MTLALCRFVSLVSQHMLPAALLEPERVETEPVGLAVDLSEVKSLLDELVASNEPESTWDRIVAPVLHQKLRNLPRRLAADMRLWQWLCIAAFPEFVWHRWCGGIPSDMTAALRPSVVERFLGAPTLRGISRNTFARLWWCAECLYDERDGYKWVEAALANQDFFQGIFERELGLYPPAARACIRVLLDETEEQRRQALKRLNHLLTTIVLEVLDEQQIMNLLRSA